ncbi:AraC family transcriptional regulator [Paenibacillus hamazuiensis]|uniref:AraC family transcriptional regulator n=1 Tax=Paenibacillus hamazuiensis TaxID=2936508 RepID=UPI0020100B8D|nr:AraC family transcriptional regulator [Paenibacillus hamazuiensis]
MGIKMIDLPPSGILLYESKHKDGDVVGEHRHAIHQILYAIDGHGHMIMNGRRFELGPDTLAMIVPHSDHSIVSEKKLTLLVLAFEAEALDAVIQQEILGKRLKESFATGMNPFLATDIRQLLRKLMFEQGNRDQLGLWALRIYLQEMLLLLSRSGQPNAAVDSNGLRAERIRKYIEDHYFEPITAADLSARMNISARHLNNIFKECYGVTPIQYMTEVRIGAARKLLAETEKDIVTVCFEVGYENLPTFYRAFRNIVKLSPNKFRQQAGRLE